MDERTTMGSARTQGFLFADLRGYTAFVEAHGDRAAADLLASYRTVVRAAVRAFAGAEIRTEGDSFYVVFPSVGDAVECGLAIASAAARTSAEQPDLPLHVGVGIHAGETIATEEGFVGSAVNIAARIGAEAGAGEVLVSETVRALVRTSLEVRFFPRGRRQLKGLREPIALYAVAPVGTTASTARFADRPPLRAGRSALGAGALALAAVVVAGAVLLRGFSAGGAGSSSPSPTPVAGGFASAGALPSATPLVGASASGEGPQGVITFISSQSVGSAPGTGTGDRSQIYTLDLVTGQRSGALTPIGEAICAMALAPDGHQFVYTAGRPCFGVDALSSGPPTVIDLRTGAAHRWPGTWRADVCSGPCPNLPYGRSDDRLSSGASQALVTGSGLFSLVVQPHALAWAGDGTLLTYAEAGADTSVGGHPKDQGIYAIAADGSGARLLVPLTLTMTGARQVDFQGGRPDEITWQSGFGAAADGRSIAYARPGDDPGRDAGGYWLPYPSDIWTTDMRGTAPAQVTQGVESAVDPTWAPDGTRIAFSGTGDIWVVDAQGSGLHRLTNDAADDQHPTWSPDGAWIAWSKLAGVQRQLWVMRADGTDPHLLFAGDPGESLSSPLWVPAASGPP
ncbi:MAG: adenylate/guanylate cyclase domain-containing protein [Candidatus Limnocylindrales bacterium]